MFIHDKQLETWFYGLYWMYSTYLEHNQHKFNILIQTIVQNISVKRTSTSCLLSVEIKQVHSALQKWGLEQKLHCLRTHTFPFHLVEQMVLQFPSIYFYFSIFYDLHLFEIHLDKMGSLDALFSFRS